MSYDLHKVRLYLYTLEFQSRFELLILFLIVISYPDLSLTIWSTTPTLTTTNTRDTITS